MTYCNDKIKINNFGIITSTPKYLSGNISTREYGSKAPKKKEKKDKKDTKCQYKINF